MAHTKSAERRARSSARRRLRNRSVKSRIHTLEKKFRALLAAGQKEQAVAAFRTACSAIDKAVKGGVLHRATANRKKSRLAARLNKP